jgi:hypothetical protein
MKLYQIHDRDGNLLYSSLLAAENGVMLFTSGWGFITEYQIRANGWRVSEMV